MQAGECTSLRETAKRTTAKQAEDKQTYANDLSLKSQTIEYLTNSVCRCSRFSIFFYQISRFYNMIYNLILKLILQLQDCT